MRCCVAAGCCSELSAVAELIAGWMCIGFCVRGKNVLLLLLLLSVAPTGAADRHLTNRQSYKYSPFRNVRLEITVVCHCCVVVRQCIVTHVTVVQ